MESEVGVSGAELYGRVRSLRRLNIINLDILHNRLPTPDSRLSNFKRC